MQILITQAQVYRYFSITIPLVKFPLSLITSDWIPGFVLLLHLYFYVTYQITLKPYDNVIALALM